MRRVILHYHDRCDALGRPALAGAPANTAASPQVQSWPKVVAYDAGRVYVATGFGRVTALNPATGKKLWEKVIGIPIRSSPTAAQNKVFVLTTSGRFFCLKGDNGEIIW